MAITDVTVRVSISRQKEIKSSVKCRIANEREISPFLDTATFEEDLASIALYPQIKLDKARLSQSEIV